MERPHHQYIYRGRILRWVDGDTCDIEVELGFHLVMRDRFRLYGIDTPEMRGDQRAAGFAATHRARELVPEGANVLVQTFRDRQGKYGRWLAEIYPPSAQLEWPGGQAIEGHVNGVLLAEGYARPL